MADGTATYLYCVVKSARRPAASRGPAGLAGATAPAAVELGQALWLIVGEVPLSIYGPEPLEQALGDMAWVSDAAVAHDAVVEYCARLRGATAVPMKMFTMFSTLDRAVADMRGRRRELEAVVKRIAGCDEWGVRVMRAVPAAAPGSRRVRSAGTGAAFLAAKKQVRDEAREAARLAAAAAEEAYAGLAALAKDVARRQDVPAGASTPPLLDAAFLVPSTRRTRFKSAARRLAGECQEAGASMSLTGPWPAYNFVQPSKGAR
jgi:hypothetical protein